MKKQRPVCTLIVLLALTTGLAACQTPVSNPFKNLFGSSAPPPPPPPSGPSCTDVNNYNLRRIRTLEAENAKLKKDLADATQDNAMLRDLTTKKER
jgi:hypothetical protein